MTAEELDDDWEMFDLLTQVSYIPYDTVTDANIAASTVTEIDAVQLPEEKKEVELGEGVKVFMRFKTWPLRVSTLGGVPITKRGIIQEEDGTQWAVESVSYRTLKTRAVCECVYLGQAS